MRLRARKAEDKQERRGAILEVALKAFNDGTFGDVKMSDVAERTGLAKGTVFLYFPTKEALFLALLEEQLTTWFDELDRELARSGEAWAPKHAAKVVTGTIVAREPLARLLALLHGVLEQNVERAPVLHFKRMLLERLAKSGKLLEARLPFLPEHGGARLLLTLHALVIGLRQMADPAPVVKEIWELPEMAPLKVDFAKELEAALENLLAGLERTRGKRG